MKSIVKYALPAAVALVIVLLVAGPLIETAKHALDSVATSFSAAMPKTDAQASH